MPSRSVLIPSAIMMEGWPGKAQVACVTCSGLIVEEYAVVKGQAYHHSCFACALCCRPITGSYFEDKGIFWCERCHEAKAPRCRACSCPILGRYATVHGQLYHCNCFLCSCCGHAITGPYFTENDHYLCERCNETTAPRCDGCQQPISGKYMTAEGKHYHRECFVCAACSCILSDAFFPENGQTLCSNCYDTIHPPKVCHTCRQRIKGPCLQVGDLPYHKGCLVCCKCHRELDDVFVESEEGHGFVCRLCQPRCALCAKHLTGKHCFRVGQQQFHSACFRCSDCNSCIADRYFEAGFNKYRCLACHMRALKGNADAKVAYAANAEALRRRQEAKKHRLFWRPELVPCSRRALQALGVASTGLLRSTHVCVCYDAATGLVDCAAAPKANIGAAVNIAYLICMLKILHLHRREPAFSLDPKDPHKIMGDFQVKRFHPSWLEGSVVGEVLFQADYGLKQICLGDQRVPSLPDLFERVNAVAQQTDQEFAGRQWFVIRRAGVRVASDGVVVPSVEMGVEARRLVPGASGYTDAPHTDPDDPFVRQAAAMTSRFADIAACVPAVGELMSLAKALTLASYLLGCGCCSDETLLEKYVLPQVPEGCMYGLEIPTLVKEKRTTSVEHDVASGQVIVGTHRQAMHGGVDLKIPSSKLSVRSVPVRLLEPHAPRAPLPLFEHARPPLRPPGAKASRAA